VFQAFRVEAERLQGFKSIPMVDVGLGVQKDQKGTKYQKTFLQVKSCETVRNPVPRSLSRLAQSDSLIASRRGHE
jgi:hypothetical protein